MRCLNRKTLEWEEINIKGKTTTDYLEYKDETPVNFFTTLAVDGDIKTKGLGYCTWCGRIMTKKEYEKHVKRNVSAARCANCPRLCIRNKKIVKKNGEYIMKGDAYCGYKSEKINPEMQCSYGKCCGSFSKHILRIRPRVPLQILTMASVVNNKKWNLSFVNEDAIKFTHIMYNLSIKFDNNGYFISFVYKNTECYYDASLDKVYDKYGVIVTDNERIKHIMRRLYED